jgi:hypothetical protein
MKDRPEITAIEHKFLEPGHTHMECDADHGKIEKKQKNTTDPISHPYDWRALVRSCGFTVLNMTCEHFLDISEKKLVNFKLKFKKNTLLLNLQLFYVSFIHPCSKTYLKFGNVLIQVSEKKEYFCILSFHKGFFEII